MYFILYFNIVFCLDKFNINLVLSGMILMYVLCYVYLYLDAFREIIFYLFLDTLFLILSQSIAYKLRLYLQSTRFLA